MKTARRTFKEPYVCLQPWEEDTFVQCGGDGIVISTGDLEKSLKDPKEGMETIKAVVGEESTKKHYRTAFFEAFPKNPSCFLRGEGATIEEAEENCFKKYQKVLACKDHEFDRRNRTDGYCFCTKCPLSGYFLEPLTKCTVCQIPTKRHMGNNIYKCVHHYISSPVEQIVDKDWTYVSVEEQEFYFIEEQLLYQELQDRGYDLNDKSWDKFNDYFIRVRRHTSAKYKPLFGEALLSDKEIHEIVKKELPSYVDLILEKLK